MTKAHKSTTDFLKTALMPAHSTLYIWGGGWSADDKTAGADSMRLGLNPEWERFYKSQNGSYDFKDYRYRYGCGLDCSGYVGWAVYNFFGVDDKTSYVTVSKNQGRMLAEMGFGVFKPRANMLLPGDIVSSIDHVYITVKQCRDGSVILLHSSPPGVQLCGTAAKTGCADSEANRLVKYYTERYYPDWYKKFSYCTRGSSYLKDISSFSWYEHIMPDSDCLRQITPKQVMKLLFE